MSWYLCGQVFTIYDLAYRSTAGFAPHGLKPVV